MCGSIFYARTHFIKNLVKCGHQFKRIIVNINMPNPARILINGGDGNPYHVFIYMFMIFMFDDINQPIHYYYPKSESKFIEELLPLLPSTFIRDFSKSPERNYIMYNGPQVFGNDWAFEDVYNFIRRLFEPHMFKEIKPKLYIYISRNHDSGSRRLLNENSLLEKIVPLGFTPITLSKLSVEMQIKLFSCADIIISPHGAALAFILFCNKNVTIIELMVPRPISRHYAHISWNFEYDYYKFMCKKEGENYDMVADVDHIQGFLQAHPKLNV